MVKSSYHFRRTHLHQKDRPEWCTISVQGILFFTSAILDFNNSGQTLHDQSHRSFIRGHYSDYHYETHLLDRVTEVQSVSIYLVPGKELPWFGRKALSISTRWRQRQRERDTERERETEMWGKEEGREGRREGLPVTIGQAPVSGTGANLTCITQFN